MRLTARLEAWFLAGSLIFVAGMGAGWMLWSPEKKQKVDPPAQAQRLFIGQRARGTELNALAAMNTR